MVARRHQRHFTNRNRCESRCAPDRGMAVCPGRRGGGCGEADKYFILTAIEDRSMDNRSDIWLGVDAIKPRFIALSDKVWGMPEVCYTEARSAAEHLAELRHQGFRITENVARITTTLMGECGGGGPVIAFLGEYDALPGLSQEAGVAEPRPLEVKGHGHGCGHNLLGSAGLPAAT